LDIFCVQHHHCANQSRPVPPRSDHFLCLPLLNEVVKEKPRRHHPPLFPPKTLLIAQNEFGALYSGLPCDPYGPSEEVQLLWTAFTLGLRTHGFSSPFHFFKALLPPPFSHSNSALRWRLSFPFFPLDLNLMVNSRCLVLQEIDVAFLAFSRRFVTGCNRVHLLENQALHHSVLFPFFVRSFLFQPAVKDPSLSFFSITFLLHILECL